MHRTRKSVLLFATLLAGLLFLATAQTAPLFPSYASEPPSQATTAQREVNWLEHNLDPNAPVGSPLNPALILPADLGSMVRDMPGTQQLGDNVIIPAAQFRNKLQLPFAVTLLGPLLERISAVKSFDGFSAIDATSASRNATSIFFEPQKVARRLTAEDLSHTAKLLRDGDIVFGAHLANYMTWGRYNHVAIVSDAARGMLMESTANQPLDRPGVRPIEWDKFATGYAHVGVARVRGLSADQITRVVRWTAERKGRLYRWPLVGGWERMDDSRMYCSQLVWLAFKQVGIDLDSDQGILIFPDDLYNSPHVEHIVK